MAARSHQSRQLRRHGLGELHRLRNVLPTKVYSPMDCQAIRLIPGCVSACDSNSDRVDRAQHADCAKCADLKFRHYSPLLTIRGRDALSLKNHRAHFFQRVDVAQRIAFDSDEIALLARFNRS
jgi:hypothetical protein